jgi:dicarboxylate transporter 10
MNVIQKEGLLALNHGLTAAVLRQLTYSTTRFAVYEVSITV